MARSQDQHHHVLAEAGDHRAEQEDRDGELVDRLPAVQVGDLAVERDRHRRGDQVRRHHPADVLGAAEVGDDRLQRGPDDALVQRGQEHAEHQAGQHREDLAVGHRQRAVGLGGLGLRHAPCPVWSCAEAGPAAPDAGATARRPSGFPPAGNSDDVRPRHGRRRARRRGRGHRVRRRRQRLRCRHRRGRVRRVRRGRVGARRRRLGVDRWHDHGPALPLGWARESSRPGPAGTSYSPGMLSPEVAAYYECGEEATRLSAGGGRLEWARTWELLERHLPPAPGRGARRRRRPGGVRGAPRAGRLRGAPGGRDAAARRAGPAGGGHRRRAAGLRGGRRRPLARRGGRLRGRGAAARPALPPAGGGRAGRRAGRGPPGAAAWRGAGRSGDQPVRQPVRRAPASGGRPPTRGWSRAGCTPAPTATRTRCQAGSPPRTSPGRRSWPRR